MLRFFLFCFVLVCLFCLKETDGQTYAGVPDSSHVLVVYNELDSTSFQVANYYQQVRGIPVENICPLNSLTSQTYTSDGSTHNVIIAQEGDIIRDSINHEGPFGATRHAWKYFIDNVANPIKQHLINNNLQNQIRYIVLCKGVPFKIQAGGDWAALAGNLTVDGLLCMLNTVNYDVFLDSLFFNPNPIINNPYFDLDNNFTTDYRFVADTFATQWNIFNVKLSYLVSHLDGLSLDIVKGIIDRSKNADTSGMATWVLDADDTWSNDNYFLYTKEKLEALGFNVNWNDDGKWTTHNDGPVIGYSSWGTHAEDGNCDFNDKDSIWILDSLQYFQFAPGAVFNSLESYNGNSIGTLKWRWVDPNQTNCGHTQGLATQFTQIGGTGMMAHAWEPNRGGFSPWGVIYNDIFMPAYAIGYNYVDAAYMGMKYLAWQNVIVGDPLTRIFPVQVNKILTQDSTISSGDFYGKLIVPAGIKCTVATGSSINFLRNSLLKIDGTLIIHPTDTLNFYGFSYLIYNGSVPITDGNFNFYDYSSLNYNNDQITNSKFLFFEHSYLNAKRLSVGAGEHLYFNDNSNLITDSLTLSAGAVLTFNESSNLKIKNMLRAVGTEQSKIRINSNLAKGLIEIESAKYIELNNFIFSNPLQIIADIDSTNIIIENVVYNGIATTSGWQLLGNNVSNNRNVRIRNSTLSGSLANGILVYDYHNLEIENLTISANPQNLAYIGIEIGSCPNTIISNSNVFNCRYGIAYNYWGRRSEKLSLDSTLMITNNNIQYCNTGIYIPYFSGINDFQEDTIVIANNGITAPSNETETTYGIFLTDLSDAAIETNFIDDYDCAIYLSSVTSSNIITNAIQVLNENGTNGIMILNCDEAIILNNSIYNYDNGIYLSSVNSPYLFYNTIQILNNNTAAESGVFSSSSHGIYLLNSISGYGKGIELGNSSPQIGRNIITDNSRTGIYAVEGSFPDLSEGAIKQGEEIRVFPISGLNNIYENGGEYEELYPFIGAEIHMFDADISLGNGCNTIADNRIANPPIFNTQILLFSDKTRNPIKAYSNYWGNHPEYGGNDPSHRIVSDLEVNYEPFLTEPCTKTKDGNFVIIKNSKGTSVVDTIFTLGVKTSLDSLTSEYALASKHFYDGNFNEAKQGYYNITQTDGNDRRSIEAYTKLFTISKLTNASNATLADLKNYYDTKLAAIQDTLLFKAIKHLSNLCLVAKQEYNQAINNFSEAIVQNPNSEGAFFAAIDILTTSLLDCGNTGMSKLGSVDLSAKDATDYRSKLDALLKARNNKENILITKIIPTQYSLYQNFPNPFNPTTKIQYDIPTDTKVQLKIYDVLGREVKTLVNEVQTAGRYNIEFNASNLASGVYIYQLSAKGFVKSRKMMVVK